MLRYFAARPFAGLQLPHERALSFAAVMAAAEARAFLQPCLHTLNPCVLNSRRACSGKVPRSVCSAVFSMENACSSVQDEKFSKSSCLAALGMYHCRADGRPQRTFPDLTQKRYTFSLFQSRAEMTRDWVDALKGLASPRRRVSAGPT